MKNKIVSLKLISLIAMVGLLSTMSIAPMAYGSTVSGTASVTATCGVALSSTALAFGSFAPTATAQGSTVTTTLSNNGNVDANAQVNGTAWDGTSPATPGVMPVTATKWATGAGTPSTSLTGTAAGAIVVPQQDAGGVDGTIALNLALAPNLAVQNYNGPIAQTINVAFTCASA